MDVNRSEKIRMLIRLLEPFEEEVRRVLSDEEANFANRSEAYGQRFGAVVFITTR